MKKTLIALATLAAVSGTAFAQSSVTISGKLRYAYITNSSTAGSTTTKAAGVARTDGDVVFAATEDLGGGLKATADMAIQTGGRGIDAGNRDAKLTLAGNFGTVSIGSLDAGNGIYALGSAGAPVAGLDSLIIPDSGNIDYISYTSPSYNGFGFKVLATDTAGANSGTDHQLNLDMGATSAKQDSMVYGVTYSAGPLSAAADVTLHGNNAAPTSIIRGDGRTRLSASYDLGVAKIGAGYETRKAAAANSTTFLTTKDTLLGVSVPMGAFTFGLVYAKSSTDGTAYDKKGTDFGVQYNLSKRTYIAAHHQKVTNTDLEGAAAAGNKGSFTRVQLAHSF